MCFIVSIRLLMQLEQAKSLKAAELKAVDPGTLIAVIRVVIMVIEFAKAYREELGAVARFVLRATGWDKRLDQLEKEAKQALDSI